jgi:1-acyl-sn-glycerol-3-phosphate acyltransferase
MAGLFKSIFRWYFQKTGWKVEGNIPEGVHKAIIIGGAHTSNWDLIYALGSLFTRNLRIKFIIKKEALVFPLKSFLLSLGAIPVNRNPKATTHYVDQLAEVFKKSDECFLAIAPEGTRKAVKKWKTGYYHIAKKANVPIIVCYLDYQNKIGHFGKVIDPNVVTEEESMAQMKEYLKKARPKVPENFIL